MGMLPLPVLLKGLLTVRVAAVASVVGGGVVVVVDEIAMVSAMSSLLPLRAEVAKRLRATRVKSL